MRAVTDPALEAQFTAAADRWERQTAHLSSPAAWESHPAYQQLLDLGEEIVPLLIDRLRATRSFRWLAPLEALTGEASAALMAVAGGTRHFADCWADWGRARGH